MLQPPGVHGAWRHPPPDPVQHLPHWVHRNVFPSTWRANNDVVLSAVLLASAPCMLLLDTMSATCAVMRDTGVDIPDAGAAAA